MIEIILWSQRRYFLYLKGDMVSFYGKKGAKNWEKKFITIRKTIAKFSKKAI